MIFFFAEGPSKVIITTGYFDEKYKVDLFDMKRQTLDYCRKVQPFPLEYLYGASGGVVDGFPMICSGLLRDERKRSTSCHSLNQFGEWIEDQNATVNPGRWKIGYVVLQNRLLLVGGTHTSSHTGTVFENSDKILTFVSLRTDGNFETFADAFSLLENSYRFLPILFILYNRRIEMNFQGAKKHLPRFLRKLKSLASLAKMIIFE